MNIRLAQCLTCKKHPATCEAKEVDEFGFCQEIETIWKEKKDELRNHDRETHERSRGEIHR